MITYEKIRYKNFLSVGENPIEVDFTSSRATLITGSNGSGKSSLLDALSFAQFGKAQRKIKKGQLLNSINEKNCLVELWFNTGPNKKYKIVRGIRPGIFEIWENGVLLNQSSHSRDYQKILEQNILGMSHRSFHQIVVVASANFAPFMELNTGQRRDVVEDILNCGVFSIMWQVVKERLGACRNSLYEVERDLMLVESSLEDKRKHLVSLQKIQQHNTSNIEAEIKKIDRLIADCKDAIAENKSNQKINEDAIVSLNEANELHSTLKQLKSQIGANIKDATTRKEFYEHNETCPTCRQTLGKDIKTEKNEEIHSVMCSYNSAMKSIQDEIAKVEANIANHKKRVEKHSAATLQLKVLNQSLAAYNKDRTKFSNQLKEDRSIETDTIRVLEQEIYDLESRINPLQADKELGMREKINLEQLYEIFRDSGIKSTIIRKYIPLINKYINSYLEVLNFFVHFQIDENYNETIRAAHRDNFSYYSFSEGEKTKINLAILFAWREISRLKNSVNTNLLFMDEVLDSSLDNDALDAVFAILDRFGDKTNVLLISHRLQTPGSVFDRHLQFEKHGHFTKLNIL